MKKKDAVILALILVAALLLFNSMASTSQQDREVAGYLKSISSSLSGIEAQLDKLNSRSLYNISSEMDEQGRAMGRVADELRYIRDALR